MIITHKRKWSGMNDTWCGQQAKVFARAKNVTCDKCLEKMPKEELTSADKTPKPTELAQQIRTARKEAGLLQAELGALMGVSPQTVSFWESGKSTPRGSKATKVFNVITNASAHKVEEQKSVMELVSKLISDNLSFTYHAETQQITINLGETK